MGSGGPQALATAALFAATLMPVLRRMHGVYRNYSAREAGHSVARLEVLARLMDNQFVLQQRLGAPKWLIA